MFLCLLFSSENIMAQFLMKSGGTPKEQARRRTEVCWRELFSFFLKIKVFSLVLLYVTTSELNCCDDWYLSAGDKLCFV